MGVRTLWSYLRNTVARTFQLRSEMPAQPLVVDLLSGFRRYLDCDYVWDFDKMRHRVRVDVEALRSAGFDPVVFAESGASLEHTIWLQRRKRDLQALCEVNSTLQSRSPEKILFMGERWRPPLGATDYVAQAFGDAGCPVYFTKGPADPEGAGLCLKHGAYGILTSDTDFLIYPGIRRFLNYTTLRLDQNGSLLVDGIERSLFARYLGLSEEKLPLIVGFLGNDVFSGLVPQDRRYLEYKWKMEWLPEAAAMEIITAPSSLLPADSHAAMEHYQPVVPTEEATPLADPQPWSFWETLKENQVLLMELLALETPCHIVLEPLRRAVYARCDLESVKEYFCVPDGHPQTWQEGVIVEMTGDEIKAPEPPTDAMECIALSCDYLQAAGELDDFHRQVLLIQALHRGEFLQKIQIFPRFPTMKDLHVASLFLQTMTFLFVGTERSLPPCWELFHGPLYHYLCQNPDELQNVVAAPHTSSFDWTAILKPRSLPVTSQENVKV